MTRDSGLAPIGVVIVIALAFAFSAGTAAYVMQDDKPEAPLAAGFHVTNREDALKVRMTDGDDLPLQKIRIIYEQTGSDTSIPGTAFETEIGGDWNSGEAICLTGEGPACSHVTGTGTMTGFRIATDEELLYTWTGTPKAGSEAGSGNRSTTIAVSDGSGGSTDGGDGSDDDSDSSTSSSSDTDEESSSTTSPPDLEATVVDVDPSIPTEGEDTRFHVRVENTGGEPVEGPATVTVSVDGETISTHSISDLGSGSSVTLQTDPWTATSGNHTVTVEADTGGQVDEEDESNNKGSLDIVVSTHDPGHAYEDVDNNELFTPGLDLPIPDDVIHAGIYHVTEEWSLVIPPSVGPISADRINFTSGAIGHVVVQVDLTSTVERIGLDAGSYIKARNLTVAAPYERLVLDADQGPIRLNGAELYSTDERVILRTHGALYGAGSTFDSDAERLILDADGPVDLPDATIEMAEVIDITSTSNVTLDRASLTVSETITVSTVDGATVSVDGTSISDEDDTLVVDPDGATISGTPASGSASHEAAEGPGNGKGGPSKK